METSVLGRFTREVSGTIQSDNNNENEPSALRVSEGEHTLRMDINPNIGAVNTEKDLGKTDGNLVKNEEGNGGDQVKSEKDLDSDGKEMLEEIELDDAIPGKKLKKKKIKKKLAKVIKDITIQRSELPDDLNLSPKSPSSAYTKTLLNMGSQSIIKGIVLCHWDNIIGPKVRHLWKNNSEDMDKQLISMHILNHIATHTLSGEICRDPSSPVIDTKLYILANKGLVIKSFVFGAMGISDLSVHSLSVVMPLEHRTKCIHLDQIYTLWFTRLVGKLRVLLEKGPTTVAMKSFTKYLNELFSMLSSLCDVGVPEKILIINTCLHADSDVQSAFLKKSILSHLSTCGHSVVLGSSASQVNQFVSTLALFLSPSERMMSRYVSDARPLPYHPGLCVQGMLKTQDGHAASSLKDIFYSRYPTTLIDLTLHEVRRSSSCPKHTLRHHEMKQEELHCLWRGQSETNTYLSHNLFNSFDDQESFVKNFVDQFALLPSDDAVQKNFVKQFLRYIDQLALALIRYLEADMPDGKPTKVKINEKKLRSDLGLVLKGDFRTVLAAAEKLKPGIYNYVCGDPKQEAEQMQNLMELF